MQRSMTIDVSGLQCLTLNSLGEKASRTHSDSADMVRFTFEKTLKALSELDEPRRTESYSRSAEKRVAPAAPTSASPFAADKELILAAPGSPSHVQGPSSEPARSPLRPEFSSFEGLLNSSACSLVESSLVFDSLPFASFSSNPVAGCPPHGVKAVMGKRSRMEDAFQVQPNFIDLPSCSNVDGEDKLPLRLQPSGQLGPATAAAASPDGGKGQTLHFFAVYDGHGGSQASNHCAARLHQHLSDALARLHASPSELVQCSVAAAADGDPGLLGTDGVRMHAIGCRMQSVDGSGGGATLPDGGGGNEPSYPNGAYAAGAAAEDNGIAATLEGAEPLPPTSDDAAAGSGGTPRGGSGGGGGGRPLPLVFDDALVEAALRDAFLKTDDEFGSDSCANLVGSTAVVALLGSQKIWVANCGDSRAVMCRAGKSIQLTDDHKPEREDEAARVEKAGGQVLYFNGHRVMGVLAMSRAIGDHGLRPYVISDPEISIVNRTDEDDFLLLASDGLWDVMENQEATNLAIRCMSRAWDKGAGRKAAVRIAASVLAKAAVDRGSKDNVTVVLIDLKAGPAAAAAAGGDSLRSVGCGGSSLRGCTAAPAPADREDPAPAADGDDQAVAKPAPPAEAGTDQDAA